MRLWWIPLVYILVSTIAGLAVPRLESAYLPAYAHDISASAAIAFFSAVTSGMMALTGIVFAVAFVLVQLSSSAYSPRLVLLVATNPRLYHAMGLFMATFIYALVALIWTDRNRSGAVPLLSAYVVIVLLVASMLAFARTVQSLSELEISSVLQDLGDKGRAAIARAFRQLGPTTGAREGEPRADNPALGQPTQSIAYSGVPRYVVSLDKMALVELAERSDAVIVLGVAIGDSVAVGSRLLEVHGTGTPLPEGALIRAIRMGSSRTFTGDPKYSLRLLVDIAIRALSPAVNDPTTAVQALDQIDDLLRRLGRSRLDEDRAYDANGALRLVFPMPTWKDYLDLSFDEIREYGATSLQAMRRLRSALVGIAENLPIEDRRDLVLRYLQHLDSQIARSRFDAEDRLTASVKDPQGLGFSR